MGAVRVGAASLLLHLQMRGKRGRFGKRDVGGGKRKVAASGSLADASPTVRASDSSPIAWVLTIRREPGPGALPPARGRGCRPLRDAESKMGETLSEEKRMDSLLSRLGWARAGVTAGDVD